ncbi:PREDICTED: serine--pyruvate aminotransferase-like [Nicrophorus vespilloides]|uniref:Alanine--glyoxylate aminotransferase n=1 Tax=Nicrophorus vespilloides TaxID=110193 RepID=A0ABM1MYC4_NICVS|nr:PREDICTED: serine--pyruvate aminotransferase-like [Nicrophorus vespilloides]
MDLTPFNLTNTILLGAGPINCSERVLRALSMQTMGPVDKAAIELMDETKEMLKKVFHTTNRLTFPQQTSGSGGLETVVSNILEPGDKLIVAIGGVWGERTADIAEIYKAEVVRLRKETGEVYSLDELEKEIAKHRPKLLFITHGESSTGVLQPLEGLADICHKYNCLLAVDAIITLCSDPLYVDHWKLDIVVGGTQKAVGAPPGFALLTFSPRAEKVILERKTPVPFYFNVKGIANYWNCLDGQRHYYYTYSTNMIAALREALAEKLEEGMENVWNRHRTVSTHLWKRMESIGLKLFIQKEKNRLHSINTYVLPDGIEWTVLLDHVYEKYNISLSFGIGPTANRAIRVGLMGVNSRMAMVDHIVKVLEESIAHCRSNGRGNVKNQ